MTQTDKQDGLLEWMRFVSSNSHLFRLNPSLVLQQAANEPDSTLPALAAQGRFRSGPEKRAWFRWLNKPSAKSACLYTLSGHTDAVTVFAISPDGRLIVSGSQDGKLKVWDVATGRELLTLVGHNAGITVCAFSLDGRRVLSGSEDKTLRLWDAASGRELIIMGLPFGHNEGITACAFSPDGRYIISVCGDQKYRRWNAETGESLPVPPALSEVDLLRKPRPFAFSPDGGRVVSARENMLILWDVESGGGIGVITGDANRITACAFSPSGEHIICAADYELHVWDVDTGRMRMALPTGSKTVEACAYTADGLFAVSDAENRKLRVWDASRGRERFTMEGSSPFSFSPEGHRLVSVSPDRRAVKIWEVASGQELAALAEHLDEVTACAFLPEGRRVITASKDHTLKIWNAVGRVDPVLPDRHEFQVCACALSSDSRLGFSLSTDNALMQWDTISGRMLAAVQGPRSETTPDAISPVDPASASPLAWLMDPPHEGEASKPSGEVTACAFSRDGRRIASALKDKTIRVWAPLDDTDPVILAGHSAGVSFCVFSPDSQRILSGSWDRSVRLWDATGIMAPEILIHFGGSVDACAFSPDGRRVAAAEEDKIYIWDTATLSRVQRLYLDRYWVSSCAFSPDGSLLVSALQSPHNLILWEVESGRKRCVFSGHSRALRSCAFSPDGRLVASASKDRTLRLWDVEAGRQAAILTGHRDEVTACAFSPDGRLLLSASLDSTIALWDVATGAKAGEFPAAGTNHVLAWSTAGFLMAGTKEGSVYLLKLEIASIRPDRSEIREPLP